MKEKCGQPDTYCATYQDVIAWMELQDPAVLAQLQGLPRWRPPLHRRSCRPLLPKGPRSMSESLSFQPSLSSGPRGLRPVGVGVDGVTQPRRQPGATSS